MGAQRMTARKPREVVAAEPAAPPAETAPPGDAWLAAGLAEWQRAGCGMLAVSSPLWWRNMVAINAELTRFVADRIQEDIRTQHEMLLCQDPVELREIQGRFLKTAFDQYCAETGKLVQMSQQALDRTIGEWPT